MLQSLLRRLLRAAYEAELDNIAVRHGREMGLLRRKNDKLQDAFTELADAYDELLTAKRRYGT